MRSKVWQRLIREKRMKIDGEYKPCYKIIKLLINMTNIGALLRAVARITLLLGWFFSLVQQSLGLF